MFAARLLNKFRARSNFLYSDFRQKSNAPRRMSKIVWIDMEMTGLNVRKDRIMEIACLISDNNLNVLVEHPTIIINQPDTLLASMDEWCTTTHTQTGLLDECKKSNITEDQAEDKILKFLDQNGVDASSSPLAGNSVYMDRMFLREYMPRLNEYLHYRIIDVSTVKELCKRWNKSIFSNVPRKKNVHRGIDDIKESIEELKYYRKFMFPPASK
ncbi:oligoribonuclease [Sitodiplosis mosellana]|uniref:oligoribonuclease n=1 Tax=Sitodiplosis mosellana TaxID=263140 RepID=UPI0024450E0A|nr:oligoribonuclease [Sitodiplosis mosellana]